LRVSLGYLLVQDKLRRSGKQIIDEISTAESQSTRRSRAATKNGADNFSNSLTISGFQVNMLAQR
jgi:hypothetical protein